MAQNDGTVAKMLVLTDRFNDGIDSVILPVQAVYIPLDRVIAAFLRGGDQRIIIITIRRTEKYHFFTGNLLYLVMDGLDLLLTFFQRKL